MAGELQGRYVITCTLRKSEQHIATEQRDTAHEGLDSKQSRMFIEAHIFSRRNHNTLCVLCPPTAAINHSMDMLSESESESEVSPVEISDTGC